ncbi:MAG: sulfatase-like hydrolase/transferase [Verrucomicrobiota bacterium]
MKIILKTIISILYLGTVSLFAEEAPNVILIMCDDLGWGDVGFNGGKTIKTPHLDEMAANSLKLNRFYAAAPVCSPTRGSVVTGRHPFRYGIYFANTGHLKKEEFTLYEALKTKGYRTGHFGKWHMGTLTTKVKDANRGKPGNNKDYSAPWHHGVDTSFVSESKVPTYDPMLKPRAKKKNSWWPAIEQGQDSQEYGTWYWSGEDQKVEPNTLKGDDSQLIMDRTLPFIEKAKADKKPFFAVVWFHTPHLPVVADAAHRNLYPGTSGYEANYYGCVSAMDEQIGRLRKKLRALGVAENTLLAFCSDNGPEGKKGSAPGSAAHFRGRKRSLYEGGIRVPALLEWPARISEARSSDMATGTVDYFPTIMAAVGFKPIDPERPMDGVSLLPLIEGKMSERPRPLGFQSSKQIALSDNRYKIYSGDKGRTYELYDLLKDPSETTNLAKQKPAIVGKMARQLQAWIASCKNSDEGKDY